MDERLYRTWPKSADPEWLAACHENSKAFASDSMLHVKLTVFNQYTGCSGREASAASSRTEPLYAKAVASGCEKHSSESAESGLLPFLKGVLGILRCHPDIQRWSGRGALLRYCAAYVAKCKLAWDVLALAEGGTVWTFFGHKLRRS